LLLGTILDAMPWPVNETVWGMVAALSESVIVPLVDRLLIGVKVSVIGQTEPAAIVPQLWVATTVGSDEVIVEMLSGAFPQLVTCIVLVSEALAFTLPKLTLNVSKQTEGAGVDRSIFAIKE
jgi:hypothetical protein